jgi:hypothetical protein
MTEFDELAWPCALVYQDSYENACARGRLRMQQLRVAICGLARDVADVLLANLARIERIGSLFADYRAVLYENDSTDATPTLLGRWQAGNPRVTVLSDVLSFPMCSASAAGRRNATSGALPTWQPIATAIALTCWPTWRTTTV